MIDEINALGVEGIPKLDKLNATEYKMDDIVEIVPDAK